MRKFILLFLLFNVGWGLAVTLHVPGGYATIQAALDAANTGDNIMVAPGVYYENLAWPDVDGIILESSGSALETIIDGNHNGSVIDMSTNWDQPHLTGATRIDGFTIRNGATMGHGAGICLNYDSPQISNCYVIYNNAYGEVSDGGGLYAYQSSPHISGSVFYKNRAYAGGGLYFFAYSEATISNCVLAENKLTSPGGSYGAGLYAYYQSNLDISNTVFYANNQFGHAACDFDYDTYPSLQNTIFQGNDIGIFTRRGATPEIAACDFIGNTLAIENYNNSGTITASDCWWGNISGAYSEVYNPNGTGDAVSPGVNPNPYATAWVNTQWLPILDNFTWHVDRNNTVTFNYNYFDYVPVTEIIAYVATDSTDIFPENQTVHQVTGPTGEFTVALPNVSGPFFLRLAVFNNDQITSWLSKTVVVNCISADNSVNQASSLNFIAYPNPLFRSELNIENQSKSALTSCKIFDIKGRIVKSLHPESKTFIWDKTDNSGRAVASGIYFIKMENSSGSATKKVILVK